MARPNFSKSFLFLIFTPLLIVGAKAQTLTLQRAAETGSERQQLEKIPQANTNAASDSRVFGSSIFSAPEIDASSFSTFNPDYRIQVGDLIRVQIWGALAFQGVLAVDAQGHIFIPEVGPVQVLGLPNGELTARVKEAVSEVYTRNIQIYANLETSQEVRVYVAGYVNTPGLYGGPTSENLINYLKLAGGIDLDRGSFIEIDVKRGNETLQSVNLYDFLTEGSVPLVQFADGDVIFVHPIKHTLSIEGLAKNAFQFEFEGEFIVGTEILRLARVDPIATTAVVKRSLGPKASVINLDMGEVESFDFLPGDRVIFSADRQKDTVLVKVDGEHDGDGYIVMPYGTTIGDLFERLEFSTYSNVDAIQLFRKSVQKRQKDAILASLQRLENNVLSARSSTADEARLRAAEAELLLQFVDRARNVEPLGQVVLNGENWRNVRLEEDDHIVIPGLSNLVMVQGEVNFPNTQVFREESKLENYIEFAGGFTENAEKDKIILLRSNGEINLVKERLIGSSKYELNPGDEVIVLPEVDKKYFPLIRDLSQIIYNLAIATKVVLDV
ncbi:MAG: polysaccharide biosynthesis/export family protein [Opitutales bacterium]